MVWMSIQVHSRCVRETVTASFRVGDRVGVVKGCLAGYYGHVTDRIIAPRLPFTVTGVLVRLIGDLHGENNPRFLTHEWALPLDYVEHVD